MFQFLHRLLGVVITVVILVSMGSTWTSMQEVSAANQLGTADRSGRTSLTRIQVSHEDYPGVIYTVPAGLEGAIAVGAGTYHFLVVKSDGTVVAWGLNDHGQTDVPAGLNNVVAVAGGDSFSMALKNDGTVVTWGKIYTMRDVPYVNDTLDTAYVPDGLTGVSKIFANGMIAMALKMDGTVVSWGRARCVDSSFDGGFCPDDRSQPMITVPDGLTGVIDIAAHVPPNNSYARFAALKSDGSVVLWGHKGADQNAPTTVPGGTQIVLGHNHGLVLTSANTLVSWGWDDTEQARPFDIRFVATPFVSIAAGQFQNYLVHAGGGSLRHWGDQDYGRHFELEFWPSILNIVSMKANARSKILLYTVQDPTATPTRRSSTQTLTRTPTATKTPTAKPNMFTKTRTPTKLVKASSTPTKIIKPSATTSRITPPRSTATRVASATSVATVMRTATAKRLPSVTKTATLKPGKPTQTKIPPRTQTKTRTPTQKSKPTATPRR